MEINHYDKNQLIITDKPIFYWILAITLCSVFLIVFIVGLVISITKATLIGLLMFFVSLPSLFAIVSINFNLQTKTGNIKYSKIKQVMLKECRGGKSGSRSYAYLVYLILNDDTSIKLSNRLISLSKAKEISEYIRKVIGIFEVKTIKALSKL